MVFPTPTPSSILTTKGLISWTHVLLPRKVVDIFSPFGGMSQRGEHTRLSVLVGATASRGSNRTYAPLHSPIHDPQGGGGQESK
eukprot:gene17753-biopygen24024